jgi:ribosome-binding protein aMBF1 (putative translation factor)
MKTTHRNPPSAPSAQSRQEGAEQGRTDGEYLVTIIRFLARMRAAKGVSLQEVARRAKVKPNVIHDAEQDFTIPKCEEFKAWAAALGYTWEQIWTECCP